MTFKQNTKMKAEGKHFCGGGKVKKMATGGSVESYDDAKAKAPSNIRVPKEGEPSNYRGYGWSSDTKEQAAKTAKSYFDANTDSMKKAYNTYKQKDDPSADEMSSRLGNANEEAAGRLNRATSAESKGTQQAYDLKKSMGLKKGGKVKRGDISKRKK